MAEDDFGSKLNAAMKAQQVSNQELARRMDLDGSQVRKWRREEGVDPRYSTIQRIAEALMLTPSELLDSGISSRQESWDGRERRHGDRRRDIRAA